MSTKDSSCLQGRERNASVGFNRIVCVEGWYSGWSRLRGAQQDRCNDHKGIVHVSVYALLRIIWKCHRTGKSFYYSLPKSLRGWANVSGGPAKPPNSRTRDLAGHPEGCTVRWPFTAHRPDASC